MDRVDRLDEVSDISGVQTLHNLRGGIDLARLERFLDGIDDINLEADQRLRRPLRLRLIRIAGRVGHETVSRLRAMPRPVLPQPLKRSC